MLNISSLRSLAAFPSIIFLGLVLTSPPLYQAPVEQEGRNRLQAPLCWFPFAVTKEVLVLGLSQSPGGRLSGRQPHVWRQGLLSWHKIADFHHFQAQLCLHDDLGLAILPLYRHQ